LDFHGISRFSAVFIINYLNAWRYKSETIDTFNLSFLLTDPTKKNPKLAAEKKLRKNRGIFFFQWKHDPNTLERTKVYCVGLKVQFCWTKIVRLNIRNVKFCRTKNAFCWTIF
jgi:hypothetical protein